MRKNNSLLQKDLSKAHTLSIFIFNHYNHVAQHHYFLKCSMNHPYFIHSESSQEMDVFKFPYIFHRKQKSCFEILKETAIATVFFKDNLIFLTHMTFYSFLTTFNFLPPKLLTRIKLGPQLQPAQYQSEYHGVVMQVTGTIFVCLGWTNILQERWLGIVQYKKRWNRCPEVSCVVSCIYS